MATLKHGVDKARINIKVYRGNIAVYFDYKNQAVRKVVALFDIDISAKAKPCIF